MFVSLYTLAAGLLIDEVDFTIDIAFSPKDIATMLTEYEKDFHTKMDSSYISSLIYEYTFGYPYLVSRMCQLAA